MTTASDMVAMLRRHYISDETRPAGIFAPEIAAPGGRRRADLIWQGVTAASGSALHGHEIKTSRSDLLVELADPTKSDPWQRYCDRWWLVVAEPELIEDLDLPDTWGVLAPPSGRRTRSMTILRPAPALRPHDQAPALRTLAAWLHWRGHRAEQSRDHQLAEVDKLRQQVGDLRARVPAVTGQRSRQAELVDEIVRKLGGPAPEGRDRIGRTWDQDVRVDDVVTALQDLGAARTQAQRASWAVDTAARALQDLLTNVDRGQVAALAARAAEARTELAH